MTGRDHIVFPLDVPTVAEAAKLVALLRNHVGVFKVGLELFTAEGPAAVRVVHDAGSKCFLDLKLHDIPETVKKATESAVRLGVHYLTLHAMNGPKTLATAAKVAQGTSTTLLAVTVLTSMDDDELRAIGVPNHAEQQVLHLARMAFNAGVRGLVASPQECRALRDALGESAHLVIPGVRPAGAAANDQKRIATPHAAILDGADRLVVGRPIRDAADPQAAATSIAREIERALLERT